MSAVAVVVVWLVIGIMIIMHALLPLFAFLGVVEHTALVIIRIFRLLGVVVEGLVIRISRSDLTGVTRGSELSWIARRRRVNA